MSATGPGQPVRLTPRRLGRGAVVTLVFTVGIQLGDAAFHAAQDIEASLVQAGDTPGRLEPALDPIRDHPTVNGFAHRLIRLFAPDRTEEEIVARN